MRDRRQVHRSAEEEMVMADTQYAHGMRIRREVLGDEHVDSAVAATDDFNAGFQDFLTRYAWGEIWARPGLDRRMRSAVTVAMLAALGCEEELGMHVRAALRNGLTREQIAELLLQVSVYAGMPRANRAFAVARRTMTSSDDPPGSAAST
jgi:4-carboxymuconolactone decarboxylase